MDVPDSFLRSESRFDLIQPLEADGPAHPLFGGLAPSEKGSACPWVPKPCDQNELGSDAQIENKETSLTQLAHASGSAESSEKFPCSEHSCSNRSRWGRKDDKALFSHIRAMENQNFFTFEDLLSWSNSFDKVNRAAVVELAARSDWKSTPEKLLTRIRGRSCSKFSFREKKALKRILRKEYNYSKIDYERVIQEFPGKSVEALKKLWRRLLMSKKTKNLSKFY